MYCHLIFFLVALFCGVQFLSSKLNDPLESDGRMPLEFNIEGHTQALEILNNKLDRRRLQSSIESTCNLTRYQQWLNERYIGFLASDSAFWMYQTQPQIVLNNFFAMSLALRGCQRMFESLYLYRSGRMGPINIQDSYKIMCRDYCIENDNLHEIAMNITGCSCLELSTQPGDISFTKEGDWCSQNTARLLCDIVGYCGVWNCRIDDFMCPRYEWNKKIIPYKGPGTCIRGAAARGSSMPSLVVTLGLVFGTWLVNYFMS